MESQSKCLKGGKWTNEERVEKNRQFHIHIFVEFASLSEFMLTHVNLHPKISLMRHTPIHYKRKGCFKYSPRDKILNNDLFKRFLVRNMCLSSKFLLKRHVFLIENLLKRSLLKILSLGLYLKHPFFL